MHGNCYLAGEAEEDGYEDEYSLEEIEITAADYIKPVGVPNFRKAWEDLEAETEMADDYGLGQRETLQVMEWRPLVLDYLPFPCQPSCPVCWGSQA